MEMQFDRIAVPHLQKLAGELRSQEQTLEVRLPDGMPDIGRVLGAWGQVIVRGKEWNSDNMSVSCGVMAWVLYTPEDGDGVKSVEAWLPFTMKWELPDTPRDGKILASCLLKSVDARTTSARKLMVRATLDAIGEGWLAGDAQVAYPGELPEDIQILTAQYPLLLPREAGEKPFLLEEQMDLPATGAKPEKLLYYSLQPEIVDKKVMAGKVVFRGNGILHALYRGDDGNLYSWEYDLPFSQYAELEGEYDAEPVVSIRPCVTSLDLSLDEGGSLQLKAGILGQFLLHERAMVSMAQDAYSTVRSVVPIQEQLQLSAVLDMVAQTLRAEQFASVEVDHIVDVTFYPQHSQKERTDAGVQFVVPGQFQLLYVDPEGELRSQLTPWKGEWSITAAKDSTMDAAVCLVGRPQAMPGAGNVSLRADMNVDATVYTGQGIPMLMGVELGEVQKPDPDRPSLILCRKGDRRLWDVAKQTGSTVENIMQTNHLEGEPEGSRILLIPVG